ncbi:MAG: DNA recombination protein RmuC [Chitinispirillales bacterium]|jgi:DNA recombination protein RmuC|nr:DNA recombination protein RmuC [Chitinispirillales bacterium]
MEIVMLILGMAVGAAFSFFVLKTKFAKYLSLDDFLRKMAEKDEKINELSMNLSAKETEKEILQNQAVQNKEEIEKLHERMKIEFENTANKILEEKSKKFVEVNEEKIGGLLNPLKEKISDFQKKVEETYSNEIREKASLQQELRHIIEMNKQMTQEADKLTRALKGDSKVQGDWGEFQLEVLLEKSGLTEGVNFKKQQNFKIGENENVRPDFIVYLPENKHYIIDSKVSLAAYEQYFNGEDEAVKEKALKEHIASIKRHIDELSEKKYERISAVNSPDFVFMFVPIEPALTVAVQANPMLVEYALKKNVMLVVPTTLMFAMRAIAFIWKVENQNKNVQEIAKVGGELYDKFVSFTDNMIKVGQSMDSTKRIYTDAMGQLTKDNLDGTKNAGTILGKIENLKKLGANTTKQINQSLAY